jgi:hypothetical protein
MRCYLRDKRLLKRRPVYAPAESPEAAQMRSKNGTHPVLLVKAALAYARRGAPVFPCEPGGKKPLTYNGFYDATTDPRRIRTWWHRWPGANIGIPTGERSGLLVLDVDLDDGGSESLASLEQVNGPLPKTAKARTGGGRVHVFFRYPTGETVRNSAGKVGPGLDVRGEGGYVVVPPSHTEGAYEWLDKAPLAQPVWLLERLREHSSSHGEQAGPPTSAATPATNPDGASRPDTETLF